MFVFATRSDLDLIFRTSFAVGLFFFNLKNRLTFLKTVNLRW
jgi:hypothetical protein